MTDQHRLPFQEAPLDGLVQTLTRIARTLQGELVETHGLGHKNVLREASVLDRIAIFLAPRLT